MEHSLMKDSGVEWIGEIPSNWSSKKIRQVCTCRDEERVPVDASLRKTGPYPYWGAGKVTDYVDDYLFDEELVLLGEDGAPFFDKTRDVAHIVNEKVWINNHIHVLKADKDVSARYLCYFLNIVDYGSYINGSILNKLTQSNMNKINIAFPNASKQNQITRFLDSKTSEIKSLIDNLNKQIESLKEYKKSLIYKCVTKGLDDSVPLKDSGIEWIGQIPEDWRMIPNKYIFNYDGEKVGTNFDQYSLLSLTTSGIKEKNINDTGGKVPTSYEGYQTVKSGQMVFCLFDLDVSAVFSGISKLDGMITSAYDVFTCSGLVNSEYIDYFFQYVFSHRYYKMYSKNIRYTATSEAFLSVKTPVPPLEEQNKIADYLNEECAKADNLINSYQNIIEKLTEYQKSLIYEYVTGKKEVITEGLR